jgi:hypothetical protein
MSKDLSHHEHRLLERMVQAENVTDRAEAQRILRKADKHQRKVSRLRELIRDVFGRGGDR